ncbi:hypothetical protein BCV72DRAFT_229597 [Rhizopus microsporus var. microsporus]|uniref:Conidiation-specific protein 10 n=2 Tax=Rhizopus microsporus TaxID=58291 RepID=A0A2G4T7I7_RHIZD|nr:uncharacterized protein RHIMIDRAFT_266586 [Rhizopus microsporus ATCC 52813]ORE05576.1 hypothetical protein BCV72DRAFT_229597 [Rhizopus microsporus var. microsporus]PHZ16646.1 hypothetical protein RHIMIDRAFT_266586 [Rhizopus microsporus ATCC 52813]
MSSRQNNPANFANRPKDEVQAIGSKGGRSRGGTGGGGRTDVADIGDYDQNEDLAYEEQSGDVNYEEEGTGGGTRSGKSKRGFASMDPQKQHEIASKGGKASGQSRSSGKAEDELS